MSFDFSLLKEHPYITGGVVIIGGLLVYVWYKNRSASVDSSGNTVAGAAQPTALDLANAQYGAQENLATIQANAQTNQLNAGLEVAQLEANTQTSAAQIGAQTSIAAISAQEEVLKAQYSTALQIQQSNNQTSIAMGQITAQTQTDLIDAILKLNGATAPATTAIQPIQSAPPPASVPTQTVQLSPVQVDCGLYPAYPGCPSAAAIAIQSRGNALGIGHGR